MRAEVVSLDAFRARRAGVTPPGPPPSVAPAHLSAEPGLVLLQFSNREQLVLSPPHARVWAERLAAMADTAEALEREGGR
jgi:hypothetical protein